MTRFAVIALALIAAFAAPAAHAEDDELETGTVGTGIMGVITGLGSMHVNGLRIETPPTLEVSSPLGPSPVGTLTVGDTVAVEASLHAGVFTASAVRLYHPIVAQIDEIAGNRARALGVELDLSAVETGNIATGDWVAVSGIWHGDVVVASRIRRTAERNEVIVNASFSEINGVQRVGPIILDGNPIEHARTGDHLLVFATPTGDGRLAPSRIEFGLFAQTLNALIVEGYMSGPDSAGIYFIDGTGVVAYTDDPAMEVPSERSVYCVDRRGTLSITQILALKMKREERVSSLDTMARDTDRKLEEDFPCVAR